MFDQFTYSKIHNVPPIIGALEDLNTIRFELTGSRAVRQETPESDWDFIACGVGGHNAQKIEETLHNLGFHRHEGFDNGAYADISTKSVWCFDKVHIQVPKEGWMLAKLAANRTYREYAHVFFHLRYNPSKLTELWDMLIKAAANAETNM